MYITVNCSLVTHSYIFDEKSKKWPNQLLMLLQLKMKNLKSGGHLLNTNGNIGSTNIAVYVKKNPPNNESAVHQNLAYFKGKSDRGA